MKSATQLNGCDNLSTILEKVYTQFVQVIIDDLTVYDIDEALNHLRLKLQDRYGNRLTYQQRELYLTSVDDLLDARLEIVGGLNGNQNEGNSRSATRPEQRS